MKSKDWGDGPWALPKPKNTKSAKSFSASARPELEDVFNHQVRQNYGLKSPMSTLRSPRGVWLVRGVLIAIALVLWLVALLHGK